VPAKAARLYAPDDVDSGVCSTGTDVAWLAADSECAGAVPVDDVVADES
jgi:hypothetical protein